MIDLNQNREAFLDTIAWSEGTTRIIDSDNGFDVLVGGTLFKGYADHPRKRVYLSKLGIWSTAAGRYQVLERFFDAYKELLKLPDFSPESQDQIALQQIKETGALPFIDAGHFNAAIQRVAHIWASLPMAGYKQHQNSMEDLKDVYVKSGGSDIV